MSSQPYNLDTIHELCFGNALRLSESAQAGCFDCLSIFPTADISSWIADQPIQTTLCPKCGTDTVLADDSSVQFSAELLQVMHERYFGSRDAGVVFESFAEAYEDYLRRKSIKP